jgi:hypothetical protein
MPYSGDPQTQRGGTRAAKEAAMPQREKRIQDIAYHLWVQEGRPEGHSDRHWHTAEALYEAEISEDRSVEAEPLEERGAEKPARSIRAKAARPTAETAAASKKSEPGKSVAEKPARTAANPKAAATAAKPAGLGKRKPKAT